MEEEERADNYGYAAPALGFLETSSLTRPSGRIIGETPSDIRELQARGAPSKAGKVNTKPAKYRQNRGLSGLYKRK